MSKPLVTIICITYNQEKYIKDALEGFVSQKTNFTFEVLIHDDASTDNTQQIISEYAGKYPEIIKPIFETNNVYSTGSYDFINDMMRSAKGKYIAFCEGDDYWTDPDKLQLQADLLEQNPKMGLCFHPVKVIFEDNSNKPYVFPDVQKKTNFTLEELLRDNYIQTNSVMYRKQKYASNMPYDIMPHDWFLHLYHAQYGDIGFIDRTMAVYRRHSGGVWWDSHDNRDKFWKRHGLAHLAAYQMVLDMYGNTPAYRSIIYETVSRAFSALIELSKRDPSPLKEAIKKHPDMFEEFLRVQSDQIQAAQKEDTSKQNHIDYLEEAFRLKDNHISNLETELNTVKKSRAWRALQKSHSIKTKLKRAR